MLSTTLNIELEEKFDHLAVEERCRSLWEETGVYKYDPNATGEVFSVDTPPPYVSAAHLHVGHAMSYAQAEFIVRYQRMRGRKVFYPMGFDDNGLPTERYVEQTYSINKRKISRTDFRKLCLEETAKGAKDYENLWRSLGLSVDWNLRYSTIDDHCCRTAQLSFIDLFQKDRIYRSNEPVLWDTHFETALAQADVETMNRKGTLYDINFTGADGSPLTISTTRPELIPACVALYCNPEDERYTHLVGKTAQVPLFNYSVPIKTSEEVLPEFGTGLMMVCTFGDGEDVRKWKRDNLETRIVLDQNGKLTDLAGPYAGMTVDIGRKQIVEDLKNAEAIVGQKTVEQNVSISERSTVPVEFMMVPQWFIRVMDMKDEMLQRSAELNWYPAYMKVRLDSWIEGLKYDWNISRQRFYGVPFPLWYCASCRQVVLASKDDLPVNPVDMPCPVKSCPNCGSTEFEGEHDVMDTWMTSSLTPLINANWAGTPGRLGSMDLYPLTVRVQAFEIIRTWLFYTLIKSHLHTDSLPWRDVMISGWGLNESGKKISKRDLEKFTDETGYNRYNPYTVISKYGADALRYWAAGSHLGHDMRYSEKDVQAGHKLVVKIWNAARFCTIQLKGFNPGSKPMAYGERTFEDRWMLSELNKIIPVVTKALDQYDYASARESLERFFWMVFCDNYLEIVKDRFWNPDRYEEAARTSAQWSMWEALQMLLTMFAPFIPFVTEELYQHIYRSCGESPSLHVSGWPVAEEERNETVPEMELIFAILRAVRGLRTENKISQNRQLAAVVLDMDGVGPEMQAQIRQMESSIKAIARTKEIKFASASVETEIAGLKVQLETE